ncbi:siderophore-interacting protein [Pseudogemmobacter bohemicus]|uniref:siderophore-interacting protein n=1 Tax=Pseudogemmobacter bohemicus TaxID=2250708 RepID=UPI0018E4F4A5|nr:siderophore-interacting protein [Pseudogemmobacter bohemicus]
MTASNSESVEDRSGILEEDDHMRGMERIAMEVVRVTYPFASVARVTGRIAPLDPAPWMPPNQAVRIAVEEPAGQRPVVRVYTIRSFDPVTSQVEIDFVIHEDDSPAMRWLRAAKPGTVLPMIGPRQHFIPLPSGDKRAAIFADETAIPAVYAILKAWPAGLQGEAWIETPDHAAFEELPRPEGVRLHLLLRPAGVAPGSGKYLIGAAKALPDPAGWTVWAAGERVEMRDLRNHLRGAGVARADLQVLGYWKKGMSSSDLDRARLAEYEALRAEGLTLENVGDIDLPV